MTSELAGIIVIDNSSIDGTMDYPILSDLCREAGKRFLSDKSKAYLRIKKDKL